MKKNHVILKVLLTIFCFYFITNIISTQVEVKSKTKELNAIKKKCKILKNNNKEYKHIIALESDEEYIKRIAREKLGFVEPSERVFIDITAN